MDSKYKYELLPGAKKDFDEIYNYIANKLANEDAAINISKKI